MKPCYFNLKYESEIALGVVKPCSNMVDEGSFFCEAHKLKYSNKIKRNPTIKEFQKKLLEWAQERREEKRILQEIS